MLGFLGIFADFLANQMEINVDRLCFISISGFSDSALDYAKWHNIWCIEKGVLNALIDKYNLQRLNARF